jgi:hypothetical protein
MSQPGFGARVGLAFAAFFKIIFDAAFAGRVQAAVSGEPLAVPPPSAPVSTEPTPSAAPAVSAPVDAEAPDRSALQLLGALQREGRFVDFLMQSIDGAADSDLGAAARVVHGGCGKVVKGYFDVQAVWPGEEGGAVTIDEGFDPTRVQLTGNVRGEPPFTGLLQHPGWRVERSNLPILAAGQDVSVLAPAEVEL